MPSVISKFLEKTDQTREFLKIPRHVLATGVVAACFLTYGIKVGYPLVESLINKQNVQQDSYNNNLLVKKEENKQVVKNGKIPQKTKKAKSNVPTLNFQFILQFVKLVKIMIPNLVCTETVLLTGHTICLIFRTFLSIYVANLEGSIVKYIVRKEPNSFVQQLLKWFAVAVSVIDLWLFQTTIQPYYKSIHNTHVSMGHFYQRANRWITNRITSKILIVSYLKNGRQRVLTLV